ncbi:RHS repeat-associated core domain-containing protein [Streptomyces indicus]|uniref:RHS repeat-associated core domain-containing protein n=1 Tax=Streptomyces indicus TaxID=417292 RepID=A0A1G8WGW8_9ACTN|nr:RHS repeat-associated core domain-containing protein [Streptomyces indicus]
MVGALFLALAVPASLPSLAAAASAPTAPEPANSRVSKVRTLSGLGAKEARSRVARDKDANRRLIEQARSERRAEWPKAAVSRAELTTHADSSALIGVSAESQDATRRQARAVASGTASIRVLDQRAAERVGITGVLFTVGAEQQGAAEVTVDYSSFASMIGGNWSTRLGLVRLPSCALTTPEKETCRTTTPLGSVNDVRAEEVTARTTLSAADAPTVLAVSALSTTTSPTGAGDHQATPLTASATWEAGASSGSFTWSYPITVPPAVAGPVPPLNLAYDSGSIDGRTANTNNQGSLIGEGFSLTESYIERKYGSCEDDGQSEKSDQCWKYENASLVLNGSSTELVKDDTTGQWRLKNDDASQVFHVTGADNGDDGDDIKDGKGDGKGEYWKVVTGDGTTYTFGLNKLPGADTQRTNSTWTVPVFGDDSGEPGYSSGTTFAGRAKTQAWRWNLDLVQDVHGNASTYWYAKETNHYAQNGDKQKLASYVRGGHPTEIRYGQRVESLFTGNPSGKVGFSYKERCTASSCETLNKDTADNWPDVPFDGICSATETDCLSTGPSFFTRKRLTGIETYAWSTAAEPDAFKPVDAYALTQEFFDGQDIGNSSDQVLTLTSLKRTGLDGTAISLPPVGFTYQQRPNRVEGGTQPGGANILPLTRPRMSTITSETGAITTVVLSNPECVRGTTMPAAEDDNNLSCYPVNWKINGGDTALDWFHKYRVTSVIASDPTGKNPAVESGYVYDGPGWHYSDDPFTKEKERTWSVWRGYQKVTAYTGEAGATRSKTVKVFHLGMHGDKRKDGSTRSASVAPVTLPGATVPTVTDHEQYAGQLRQEVTYDGATAISFSVNDLWDRQTASQQKSYAHTKAYFVRTSRTFQHTWLTVPKKWRTAATSHTYDPTYGMVTKTENHGEWGVGGDETCTRTWYARNEAKGLTSLVSRTRTVGKSCADTDDKLTLPTSTATRGDVLSDAATVFDNPSATAWTADQTPVLGLPTWTGMPTGYPAANGTADRNPGAGSWRTVAATTFDTDTAKLGRPLKVTDAEGRVTTTTYYPAAAGPLTGVIVTLPKLSSNGQTHKNYTYFDATRGSVTYTLDANLKRTEYARDALGRITATWLPNRSKAGGDSASATFAYGVSQTAPSWTSVAKLKADGTSYSTSYTLYDSLARQIQTQTPGANGGRILTDTRYDARGLAVRTQSDAYDSSKAPNSTYMGVDYAQAPVQNDTVYDGAGRSVKTTLSSWGTKKWDTTTSYTGDSTATSAVEGGTATRVITDALGRTTETRTYAGPLPDDTAYGATVGTSYTRVATTYTRDAKPLTVTGPDGSVWSHVYDLYGREVSSTDPDKGTVTTGWTTLDQVDYTKDSRGQLVYFGYDELGRKTGLWHTSRTDANKLAEWTFDGLLKGLPDKSVRYENGVNQTNSKAYTKEVTAYDSLGRPTTTTLTLPSDDPMVTSGAVTATTTFGTAYRLDGTLNNTKEPAAAGLPAETVETLYNDAGLPTQQSGISGYLLGVDYSAIGQVHQLELGTSASAKRVFISRTYEPGTGRLLTSSTDDQTRGPIQDLQYGYDQAGNVTSIFDRADTGAGADQQCFSYDGQRRLTDAWTPKSADCSPTGRTVANLGGPAAYWTSYTYTDSGQRKTEKQNTATPVTSTYCYDATRKHRLKAIVTSTAADACDTAAAQYTYDNAGNTETRAEKARSTVAQALKWNQEGKLAKLTEAGTDTNYLYDADGELLIRRDTASAGETVLYLGATEVHLKSGKKWADRRYSAAGSTIAVRSNKSGTETLSFLSADHHGTSGTAVTSDSTQKLSKRYTTPFGADRGTAVGTWPDDKGFLGKSVDSGTGLTHVGAREYDSSTGQFISVDPLLTLDQHQSLNGYSYANNNPATLSDPTGMAVPECLQGLISCTGGIPDTKEERERKAAQTQRNSRGTAPVYNNGRSGSAAPGSPRMGRAMEAILFTNQEIAAQLRKERVKQILDGKFDLTNYKEEALEEAMDDNCKRGARDGCAAFKLGSAIQDWLTTDEEADAKEIMERIDESWKYPNKSKKSVFGFDTDEEFQIALTLAIHGHKVMSRNDRQKPPHAGDAWVDEMRADFKEMKSLRSDGLRDHLKKADQKQKVDMVVIDLRKGGMDEDDAWDGIRQFTRSRAPENVQKVVIYGRGYMIEEDL